MNAAHEFRDAIKAAGLTPPDVVEPDGNLHRFASNGKRGDTAGWYVMHDDGIPAGCYGDWRSGLSESWRADIERTLTPNEEAEHRAKVEAMQRSRDAAKAREQAEAASKAAAIWTAAKPAPELHPYLVKKGIKPSGARLHGDALIIAMRADGKLYSLQFISPDGEKRFLFGGRVTGCYFSIGNPNGAATLSIAEGFATGATIHEATGHPVAVAFNAGNLGPVAKAMRERFADLQIILCADDDVARKDNPGITKATEAAQCIGGLLAIPDFGTDRDPEMTDFNDMALICGKEAVGRAIANATAPARDDSQPDEENAPAGDFDDWPDLLPFDEIRTPEIPARLLPNALGDFAAALANATETPEAMATMTVLGVVSAAISTRYVVSPKDGWHESVNFYTLVALPPGNTKSKVLKACTAPLVEWEREQAEVIKPEIRRIASERKSQEKIIESKRAKLAREKDPVSQRDMIDEIARMEEELVDPPRMPQLFATNSTVEQIETAAHEQGGRFAVLSDEGGIMEVFSGLYSGGKANIDVLLQGIDGGPVRVRRKDRNFDLNPFLTFALCVQPVIVQRMGEAKAFAGRGLMERFMWVLPQSKLGYRTHDTSPVPKAVESAYARAIRGLLNIPPLTVDGAEQPRILTLAPEALSEWRAFQKAVEVELRPTGRLSMCQGWGGKICGFALRFAGLLHVSEHFSDFSVISEQTMGQALELAALLMDHAIAAYGLMELDQTTHDARECWRWIQSQGSGTFKKADLTTQMRHRMKGKRIDPAIEVLQYRGLVGPAQRTPRSRSIHFAVRPELVGNN